MAMVGIVTFGMGDEDYGQDDIEWNDDDDDDDPNDSPDDVLGGGACLNNNYSYRRYS